MKKLLVITLLTFSTTTSVSTTFADLGGNSHSIKNTKEILNYRCKEDSSTATVQIEDETIKNNEESSPNSTNCVSIQLEV